MLTLALGSKCNNLHPINIDRSSGITIIGINWIRGNKKAYVTILPTQMWEQIQRITKFDRHDIVAAHNITKSDADILYMGLIKEEYRKASAIKQKLEGHHIGL